MNEIEVIWKFLDNLDEYVYATDIETDELEPQIVRGVWITVHR